MEAFAKRPFTFDSKVLEKVFNSEELYLKNFFAAMGIKGARNLKSSQTQTLWNDFETVALCLLKGAKPDATRLKRVNAKIAEYDEDEILPEITAPEVGVTARYIFDAAYNLSEVIGKPQTILWKQRYKAAAYYWDITDCEGALDRLTYGTDEAGGLGDAASLGRLLGHYPKEMMRDGLFHSQAALEAESANGHSYVEPFEILAECCHDCGFTLVVFEAGRISEFRGAFHIKAFEEDFSPYPQWAAEAFIDLRGHLKADIIAEARTWFSQTASSGLVLRAEADGRFDLTGFTLGQETTPSKYYSKVIAEAARSLYPRDCFAALRLPDPLEPGEWYQGAYAGESREEAESRHETHFLKAVAAFSNKEMEMREGFHLLAECFHESLYHSRDGHGKGDLYLQLTLPQVSSGFIETVCKDISGQGMLNGYGQARPQGLGLIAWTSSDLKSSLGTFYRYPLFYDNKGRKDKSAKRYNKMWGDHGKTGCNYHPSLNRFSLCQEPSLHTCG